MRQADWVVRTSADNALATVTRAGEPGGRHVITGISAYFSTTAPASKLIEILVGGVVQWEGYVHAGQLTIPFSDGMAIRGGAGQDVSVRLAASGAAATLGKLAMWGYTE